MIKGFRGLGFRVLGFGVRGLGRQVEGFNSSGCPWQPERLPGSVTNKGVERKSLGFRVGSL